ncbi:hypothetical protein ACVK1X_002957 [Pseudomonas sp. PvR086]|jgi:hypothetical protein|uniref:hypothetical protein n=2 Tax=Pseudomonas TaxID=286 RepID=UPI0007DCF89B|nr:MULTISPECIES: hypothetical protein [Pseudomonas]ANI60605.1 hypothetical protein PGR6_30320 [Pseudomonas sp. GR 6-02]MDR7104847.1 hypothetical protein [Pseudomonas frederiksbergensis]
MSEVAQNTEVTDDTDRKAAYKEAAVELAKGIAMGAVPFLGQAIDAYDTIESSITLYNAESADGKEDAKFDLLMAVIGWIPGPGDGLKKSMRIVNRDPQRFAPVLFDLLRFVLQECGIKTSPEELLKQVFDASKLSAELDAIISAVKGSSTFQSLPNWAKSAVVTVLATSRDNMPEMLAIVERRLLKWKGMQRNSSAMAASSKPATTKKPAGKDASVASQGADGASGTHSNKIDQQNAATKVYHIANDALGVSGEHIADYYCAETLGWGKHWDGHDKGAEGRWLSGNPDENTLGKLSMGGNPKEWHALYKLSDGANGTGIDAVWRADPATNDSKKFAIVEAKASRDEDTPKFIKDQYRKKEEEDKAAKHSKKPAASGPQPEPRKPSIVSKLGVSGDIAVEELLEPVDQSDTTAETTAPKKSRPGKKHNSTTTKNASTSSNRKKATNDNAPKEKAKTIEKTEQKKEIDSAQPTEKSGKVVLVQMSIEWIHQNIDKALREKISKNVLSSFSRHLFFTPLYSVLNGPREHAKARKNMTGPETHTAHEAIHYKENKVKEAVNKKKASLTKKYGKLSSLKEEE